MGKIIVNFVKISWWERWEIIKFIFIILFILFGYTRKKPSIHNTFFNLIDLPIFGDELRKLIFSNFNLAKSICNPMHKGVRAWEYGLFLSTIRPKKGQKVLDLGCGRSYLPLYLAKNGLQVIAFDLPEPFEVLKNNISHQNLKYDCGSMLELPYSNNSIDLVISISAIEHLDYLTNTRKTLSYAKFLTNTKKALSEMIRVLKPGGKFFLTSDLYFPKFQTKDRWPQSYLYKSIGAAYKNDDFKQVFIEIIEKSGAKIIGKIDYDFNKVINSSNRYNYRGRYFTTFSIYAEKI